MTAALRLRNLTRSFGARAVLDRLDLDLATSEIVALLGRSGSGKTTLLRCLSGLDPVPAGCELVAPPRLAMVFQEPRLLAWKCLWQNVALGLAGEDARARADAALDEVGLGGRGAELPASLSGGEAQRVALARALVRAPALLLMDEPFAAIDALTRLQMHALMARLWRTHATTTLLVTHDVDEALALADRALVLDRGRISLDLAIPRPGPSIALRGVLLGALGVEGGRASF